MSETEVCMLKKLSFFLLLNIAQMHAQEIEGNPAIDSDRYAISTSYNMDKIRTEIFLLDKKDGTVWVTRKNLIGNKYKPWEQLPPLPIQD